MSLALIEESAKEARRLAIAGSPLAVGDFRMKKFIEPLEQAGAKVPVFAQVAKAINDLVNGKEAESAANLLNLSTLLNAILYTQGQSSVDGDYRELETFPTNCSSTRTQARILKPLVHALTSTGSGRFETIKSACERGAFNDLRLIDPAIRALGDIYPELADLVAEKILLGYGPGIVPRLKATLDLKGKKSDARKLALMHQLDPAGTVALCKTALEDGSPEVKVAAITCLGEHEDCLPIVLEQANAKNKLLRAAALEALAVHDRPEVTKLFSELIQGKALDILVGPFRALRNRQVLNSLLSEGRRVFDLMLKGDGEQMRRYWEILGCLEQRKDSETEEFLLHCFDQCEKLAKLKAAKTFYIPVPNLTIHLASMLDNIGSPKSLNALIAKRNSLPAEAFIHVFSGALRTWPAERVYLEFAPLLELKKQDDKIRIEQMMRTIRASCRGHRNGAEETEVESAGTGQNLMWDARWLDAAIKSDQPLIVYCLASPGHKGAIAYLLQQGEGKNLLQTGSIIQALAQCQYAKITDTFLDLVASRTKTAKHFDYELQLLFGSARHLPAADLPRLDAFAATLDEKFMDKYLEAIAPLRPTHQPN